MSTTPRVLLLAPDHAPSGDGIRHIPQRIASHAARVRCRVLTLGDSADELDQQGIGTRRVSPRGPHRVAVASLNAAALADACTWRPDVVFSGHVSTAFAARLIRAPFVQYLCATELEYRPRLTAFAARHASASIVPGELGRSLALAAGADDRRIHVIPPGLDLPAGPTATLGERGTSIVGIGTLEDRDEGFDVLVRAFALIRSRVPRATLTLVGGGQLRSSLEAIARANGCDGALRITGPLDIRQRDAVLRAASVFVMPGRRAGRAGLALICLEAGARGTPVVAANVGGTVDAVVDGRTGILVAPENQLEMAVAISALLLDCDLAARLGAGGRRWAEGFSWPIVARQVEDVLIAAATRVS